MTALDDYLAAHFAPVFHAGSLTVLEPVKGLSHDRRREVRRQFLKFLVAAGLSVPVNLGSRLLLSRIMPYEAALVVSHCAGC